MNGATTPITNAPNVTMSTNAENESAEAPTESTEGETVDVERLASKIEAAPMSTLDENDQHLSDILEGLLRGEIKPEDADDAIRAWVNEEVNIPFIGEAAESRLLETVQTVVKSAVVSAIRSL